MKLSAVLVVEKEVEKGFARLEVKDYGVPGLSADRYDLLIQEAMDALNQGRDVIIGDWRYRIVDGKFTAEGPPEED
ncbi:hypothetical protein ES703_52266 [subsurface metagenome]